MISLDIIKSMARSPVRNYIVPGLTSSIIGAPHEGGCVRLFESSRNQQEAITPHSHRFNFHCVVLTGKVRNRHWTQNPCGDAFHVSSMKCDEMGKYSTSAWKVDRYRYTDTVHEAGHSYYMKAEEIHSIYFGADTSVLFFEGPQLSDTSLILEPWVNGEKVPTFETKPWMFQKEPTH